MAKASFLSGIKISRSVDRSTAPSTITGNAAGSGWWQGGQWFDVITDGLPDLTEHREIIYPQGHAGKRFMNAQQAVVGRIWSEGGFSAPVTGDFLGLLLYSALGEASTNLLGLPASLIGTPASAAEPINVSPKSLVLQNQPTEGGKFLRFELKGTGDSGTIAISGIDVYGNGASETISFSRVANGVLLYSKTAFSSIGASGITVTGLSAASLTLQAIDQFQHTFRPASGSSGITLSIERIGAPEAGAASKSFMHVGMVPTELTLNTPAKANDGIFTIDTKFVGDPTATCNSTAINSSSPMRIWPAWTALVRRDGGTAWNTVTDLSIKIETGNKNVMTGTGAQGPQSTLYAGFGVTGGIKFLVDNEVEYNKWAGASVTPLHIRWNTPWKMSSANNLELNASLLVNLENFSKSDSDGAQELSFDMTSIEDAGIGGTGGGVPVQFLLKNSVPNY